jgi:lysophospholipase-3
LASLRITYKSDDLTGSPDLVTGNGDGSVNIRSLEACTSWRGLQKQPITTMEVPKAEHFEILGNQKVVKYVLDVMIN